MDHHPHHSHHTHQPHHHNNHQQHHQSHTMYTSNTSSYTTPHMISTPNYSSTHTHSRPPFNPSFHGLDPLNSPFSGSGGGGGDNNTGYEIDPNTQKKKRGRPRKYSPDNSAAGGGGTGGGGGIGLALSPIRSGGGGGGGGGGGSGGGGGENSSGVTPDNSSKKNRGRPSGSSKKQLDALGNCGVGFTPHVILVNAGEDISSKIVAFSKQGARTVCVLSANGTICNVDLRQPAMSGGVVKYEGRYEIISLSGSFLFSENSDGQVRTGGLSVSLAGTDGRVLGGGVVGVLRAASPVQIIVGSFIADGKKPKYMPSVTKSSLNISGSVPAAADSNPLSQDVSTDGSDDNGSNHIDRNTGSYANSNHPGHHNMQMYSQMHWPNPGSKMLQN
ncbi:AT-hook motif nuclear-localized protein 8-like [Silene latifolia]|uniref:AT-hook motif nuclear-localized protein 8-like n=1 Tax=Silene latifolia TaxID=37657 RepID=UPI003D76BB8E